MGEKGYMYNQKGVVQEQSTPILLRICGRAHSGLAFDKFECITGHEPFDGDFRCGNGLSMKNQPGGRMSVRS